MAADAATASADAASQNARRSGRFCCDATTANTHQTPDNRRQQQRGAAESHDTSEGREQTRGVCEGAQQEGAH